MTEFIGNERKFPLRDLTGEQKQDSRLIREHFERVKGFVPRTEPITSGADLSTSSTLPTTTTWVTINVGNDLTVPTNAVGVRCFWYAQTTTASTWALWRMDSSDTVNSSIFTTATAGGRPVFLTASGAHYTGAAFNAYFSPGTSTFQLRFYGTPASVTQDLLYMEWIY